MHVLSLACLLAHADVSASMFSVHVNTFTTKRKARRKSAAQISGRRLSLILLLDFPWILERSSHLVVEALRVAWERIAPIRGVMDFVKRVLCLSFTGCASQTSGRKTKFWIQLTLTQKTAAWQCFVW